MKGDIVHERGHFNKMKRSRSVSANEPGSTGTPAKKQKTFKKPKGAFKKKQNKPHQNSVKKTFKRQNGADSANEPGSTDTPARKQKTFKNPKEPFQKKPYQNSSKKPLKGLKSKTSTPLHEQKNLSEWKKMARSIWEVVRSKHTENELRAKKVPQLFNILKDKVNMNVYAQDSARIIISLLKHGSPDIHQSIFDALKPIAGKAKNKYARYVISAMCNCGTKKIKNDSIEQLYGHVVDLMCSKFGSIVVNKVYNKYGNKKQKLCLKQELYGDQFKVAKRERVKNLKILFAEHPELKQEVLHNMERAFDKIISKTSCNSPMLHTALWEFLCECEAASRQNVFFLLRSHFQSLLLSKDGVKVGMFCIWHGSPKDRKAFVKSCKNNVKDLAMSDVAYTLLLAIFDSIDDTVAVAKYILKEIIMNGYELAQNQYGRKVLLYLFDRRNPTHFNKNFLEILEQGDNNEVSKKDRCVREKELLAIVSDPFLLAVADDPKKWLDENSISILTLTILKSGAGPNLEKAYHAIVDLITKPVDDITEELVEKAGVREELIEKTGIHIVLRKLIEHDKVNNEKEEATFGSFLASKLTAEILKRWVKVNRGILLLMKLLESPVESIAKHAQEVMLPCIKIFNQSTPSCIKIVEKLTGSQDSSSPVKEEKDSRSAVKKEKEQSSAVKRKKNRSAVKRER